MFGIVVLHVEQEQFACGSNGGEQMFGNVVNSRAKTLPGAKPCVFSGNVAPGVAEVRSLFPWFRISIWESCRQKAHRAAVANRKKN